MTHRAVGPAVRRLPPPLLGAVAVALVAWPGCQPEPLPSVARASPPRVGRYGSLRDLVLFARSDRRPDEALFLDRFEVTRGDWAAFAASPAGARVGAERTDLSGDPSVPVSGVDLRQARAFASWRFLRLPRREEWTLAAVGDGRSRFPWGSRVEPARANTSELGLANPTPVGTFESGRRASANAPYDLVGNVSEWTESVPARWCDDELDPSASWSVGWRAARRVPAMTVWAFPGGLLPLVFAAEAGGEQVPREVVGADFHTPMEALVEAVPAGDRRSATGLRLAATARELLRALAAETEAPNATEREQLRRFLDRGRHRELLAIVWRELRAAGALPGSGPLAELLDLELALPASEAGR